MKQVANVKEFNKVITDKKVAYFFSIYKCPKNRKINIYKFLEKLFEYLESLKSQHINRFHLPSDNEDSLKPTELKIKNELNCFSEKTNENLIIDAHFKNFVSSYNFILKLTLLQKWLDQNQHYVHLVFEDL